LNRRKRGGGGGRCNHDNHGGQASSWLTINMMLEIFTLGPNRVCDLAREVIKNDRDISLPVTMVYDVKTKG
jgi:hypothetical protein